MRDDKKAATRLRKRGLSYHEIAMALNIPKSTLSNWFANVAWSQKTKKYLSDLARINASQRMTIISRKRKNKLEGDYRLQRLTAVSQFKKFQSERLFIAGLMIYWAEGDNKLANGIIRVANSDPLMIRLFYKFLKIYFPEISARAKVYLVLYPDLNDEKCRQYWSRKIGLPIEKFIKSSYIKGKHPTKRLAYGIGTLTISSRSYKEKIITWIDLAKKEDAI